MRIYICDRCGKECSYNEIKMPFSGCFELCPNCNKKLDRLIDVFFKGSNIEKFSKGEKH